MNKEYLYLNGKCVVYDQNGAIKDKEGEIDLKDYNSNFDEILIQENIIEDLEDSLEETTKEIEKRKKLVKSDKHTIWFDIISFASMPLVLQKMLQIIIGKEVLIEVMSNGDVVNTILKILILSLTAVFGGAFTLSAYSSYKSHKRKLEANESKKEMIEKSLEKEKQKLEELEQTKQSALLEEEITSKDVNYLRRLIELREYLDLFYNCGYNKQKYERYLKSGKLEKKLERKQYREEEIKLMKEYLESKQNEYSNEQEMKLIRK